MSDPKGPFEAAVRALVDTYCVHAVEVSGNADITKADREAARACVGAALPPDPAPEEVSRADIIHAEELWKAVQEFTGENKTMQLASLLRHIRLINLRALRASLLPGEEP